MAEAVYTYTPDVPGQFAVWSPFIDEQYGPMTYTADENEARAICERLNAIKGAIGEVFREAEYYGGSEYARGLVRAARLIEMEVA